MAKLLAPLALLVTELLDRLPAPGEVSQRHGMIPYSIERQAIHRGSHASVTELNTRTRTFIDGWNDRRHPFVRASSRCG